MAPYLMRVFPQGNFCCHCRGRLVWCICVITPPTRFELSAGSACKHQKRGHKSQVEIIHSSTWQSCTYRQYESLEKWGEKEKRGYSWSRLWMGLIMYCRRCTASAPSTSLLMGFNSLTVLELTHSWSPERSRTCQRPPFLSNFISFRTSNSSLDPWVK